MFKKISSVLAVLGCIFPLLTNVPAYASTLSGTYGENTQNGGTIAVASGGTSFLNSPDGAPITSLYVTNGLGYVTASCSVLEYNQAGTQIASQNFITNGKVSVSAGTYSIVIKWNPGPSAAEFWVSSINTTIGSYTLSEPAPMPSASTSIVGSPAPVPLTPTGITVTQITKTSALLSWNVDSSASSYSVYLNGNKVTSGISGSSFSLLNLLPGASYTASVGATNSNGTSLPSADDSFKTVSQAPTVKITPNANGTLTVTWGAVPNAVSYEVSWNGTRKVTDITQTSYTLTNLLLGTPVTVVVSPVNITGTLGDPSTPQTSTPELAGPSVTLVRHTTHSVTLNWNAIAGATTYDIFEGDPTMVDSTPGTSATISNLSPNQQYSFFVIGVTPNGKSLPSSNIYVSTSPLSNVGFSPFDVFNNAVALIGSLGGLLLLAITAEFTPRLVRLFKSAFGANRHEGEYYRESGYWNIEQRSSTTSDLTSEIKPINPTIDWRDGD